MQFIYISYEIIMLWECVIRALAHLVTFLGGQIKEEGKSGKTQKRKEERERILSSLDFRLNGLPGCIFMDFSLELLTCASHDSKESKTSLSRKEESFSPEFGLSFCLALFPFYSPQNSSIFNRLLVCHTKTMRKKTKQAEINAIKSGRSTGIFGIPRGLSI